MVEGAYHSKFPASQCYRWINCPLSITKGSKMPEPPSTIYALEGTAAHSLAEHCIRKKKNPKNFLGKKIKVKNKDKIEKVEVTQNMIDAVSIYVKYALKKLKAKQHSYGIEQYFNVEGTNNKVGGTIDFYFFDESILEIADYKHGAGVAIKAEGNKQLMIYALALIDNHTYIKRYVKEIKLTIIQPRAHEKDNAIDTWLCDLKTLETFRKNIIAAVRKQKLNPNQANSGPWCKWCKVEAVCEQLYKESEALAVEDFKPDGIDEIFIASIIEKKEQILSYIKAVENYAWQKMIVEGKKINGLKIIKSNSRRKYKYDDNKIFKYLVEKQNYDYDDIFIKGDKLKPITQLEKIIDKKHLNKIIDLVDGKEIIVAESDDRPEHNSAIEDFK